MFTPRKPLNWLVYENYLWPIYQDISHIFSLVFSLFMNSMEFFTCIDSILRTSKELFLKWNSILKKIIGWYWSWSIWLFIHFTHSIQWWSFYSQLPGFLISSNFIAHNACISSSFHFIMLFDLKWMTRRNYSRASSSIGKIDPNIIQKMKILF